MRSHRCRIVGEGEGVESIVRLGHDGDAEAVLELVDAAAADADGGAIVQPNGVVSPFPAEDVLNLIESDDGRAGHADERGRVEPRCQGFHALADHVGIVGSVELGVRAVRRDVRLR